MKSLKQELEKIKVILNSEEVIDNKETISLYTLNNLVENRLNKFKKYSSNYYEDFTKYLNNTLKKQSKGLFNKNSKCLKKYKVEDIQLYIVYTGPDNRKHLELKIHFKTKIVGEALYITLKKYFDVENICIEFGSYGYINWGLKEQNEIKKIIIDKLANDITELFNDHEDFHTLIDSKSDFNTQDEAKIHYINLNLHQTLNIDNYNLEFFTNGYGKTRYNFYSNDIDILKVQKSETLLNNEFDDFINNNLSVILKRIPINVVDLNNIYKKIVTESTYYNNLDHIIKLSKTK